MKKTIGIVGGMGPLATCDLFRKIVEITDASSDQEHVHILIDNNTGIPDRTAAILSGGEDPVPEILKSAVKLETMGADALIMPCNTAHYFYGRIAPCVNIPFLNMPEETAGLIRRKNYHKVGLLATDGTIRSGVYGRVFDAYGIEAVIPSAENQRHVTEVIYKGVKAGNMSIDLTGFNLAMDELTGAGAEILVLGCTELPVAFEMFHIERPAIDPTLALAAAAVRFAGAKVRKETGY